MRVVAAAQQVELAEVQVSAAFLAELTTADPSPGSGHHGPGDPGPVAGLQHREAVGPGRLQHLAELLLGQRDFVEQRVQGHAAPVRAQDLGDEAAHLRVRHGAALASPRRAGRSSGENRNLREPRGRARAGPGWARPGPTSARSPLRRRQPSPVVSVSHSAPGQQSGCHRPDPPVRF